MKKIQSLGILNRLAETYVRLVLAVGGHDPDEVDAYYGPEERRAAVAKEDLSLDRIRRGAVGASAELRTIDPSRLDDTLRLRHRYLLRQLQALIARVDILAGLKMTFDEESKALYDAVAPVESEEHYKEIVERLGALLPGKGPVPERFTSFRERFVIPPAKLDRVFTAAIEESRKRTLAHITLPPGESFAVEYVKGKTWSGYNWFKGGAHSLLQVNTDFPITIDRAVDLGSHEGYPGHHVYNSLLEAEFVRKREWVEFSVYALFSPQSLIAEGTANFGIDVAFPGDDRVRFEHDVLFPLAGLDAPAVEKYYAVHKVFLTLAYAGNEAARRYLDGSIAREEAVRWLVSYALFSHDRAVQRTKFFDQYRSYVINYNLGQDMVKRYVASRGGKPENPGKRWTIFADLLSSPRLPSDLRTERGTTPKF